MSTFSREYIGSIKVNSGKMLLIDPANLHIGRLGPLKDCAWATNNEEQGSTFLDDMAMAFATPFKDGEYKVYGTYDNESRLTGIEIQLSDS